jgi:DNA polymerase III gamma/tau subunit
MEDSKRFIEKISIQPYESFSIYILRGIDTATHQASNSLLKILEDTPPYALILLTATFPE